MSFSAELINRVAKSTCTFHYEDLPCSDMEYNVKKKEESQVYLKVIRLRNG